MTTKQMASGAAILTTSSGICTMTSPLSENMTSMVNSSATKVMGLIFGMKTTS